MARGATLVSFHHGAHFAAGKDSVRALIGGTASGAEPWDTMRGQDVIAVRPDHFICRHRIVPEGRRSHAVPGRGVASGVYPCFTNVPDERYPAFDLHPAAGTVELLFAGDHDDQGTQHVLGFTRRRDDGAGVVVAHQPGEHEPAALDPDDNNLQVLVNAIHWGTTPRLRVVRGPEPRDAALRWDGGLAPHDVHRSADRGILDDAGTRAGTTTDRRWTDAGPGRIACCRVRRRTD